VDDPSPTSKRLLFIMVSDFCFLSLNNFDIIRAFLSFIGEGYIMVAEKVIAS
jgi:hypothetical protein